MTSDLLFARRGHNRLSSRLPLSMVKEMSERATATLTEKAVEAYSSSLKQGLDSLPGSLKKEKGGGREKSANKVRR
jgi:hypothetical protein